MLSPAFVHVFDPVVEAPFRLLEQPQLLALAWAILKQLFENPLYKPTSRSLSLNDPGSTFFFQFRKHIDGWEQSFQGVQARAKFSEMVRPLLSGFLALGPRY